MVKTYIQLGATRILYDAGALPDLRDNCLLREYWMARDAVTGRLRGRAIALEVSTPAGPAVLRRFCRGGMVAGWLGDRYLYTGWARSRAFREWRLLGALRARDLPVPQPLAASCERAGPWYRAGLLTARIAGVETLADRFQAGHLEAGDWRAVGATLRRFHDAGVEHADLNARNILLDDSGRVYLIDFDRGRMVDPATVRRRRSLSRLRRSLNKLGGAPTDGDWAMLRRGYEALTSSSTHEQA